MCRSPTRQSIHFRDIHLKYFGILHLLLLSFLPRLHNLHGRRTAWDNNLLNNWKKKIYSCDPRNNRIYKKGRNLVCIHAVVSKDWHWADHHKNKNELEIHLQTIDASEKSKRLWYYEGGKDAERLKYFSKYVFF